MTAYFDGFAQKYGEVLQKSLSVTGENQEYFAERRVEITRRLLAGRQGAISRIVDFGCGLGTAAPHLVSYFSPASVVGVDVSREILKEAADRNGSALISFAHLDDFSEAGELVFCNGVVHHIVPAERAGALEFVRHALRNAGFFALWENNPLNPGTRYVMSRCDFDADAITITPQEARRLLAANGFEIIQSTSAFFFPRKLSWMRGMEPILAPTMMGGQYLLLARAK